MESRHRRTIVVLSEADWRVHAAQGLLAPILNDPEVAVLILTTGEHEWSGLEQRLSSHDLLRPRTVLIQDPYDADTYFDAGEQQHRNRALDVARLPRSLSALGCPEDIGALGGVLSDRAGGEVAA